MQQQQQKVTQQTNINKIAMIEDDEEIAELLLLYLQQFGYSAENFSNPLNGLKALQSNSYSLLILDLSLPKIDGLELLKEIRKFSNIPIIISSARGSVRDKVEGLNLGADDYLPKPYEPIELIARIKAILKRMSNNEINKFNSYVPFFTIDSNRIFKNGEYINLTGAEYEIMKIFIENSGKILSRDEILDQAKSISWDSIDRTIDVIVSRIRHKIENNPRTPEYILSIRGVGYKFVQPSFDNL